MSLLKRDFSISKMTLLMIFAIPSLTIFSGCGKDDDGLSEEEISIALNENNNDGTGQFSIDGMQVPLTGFLLIPPDLNGGLLSIGDYPFIEGSLFSIGIWFETLPTESRVYSFDELTGTVSIRETSSDTSVLYTNAIFDNNGVITLTGNVLWDFSEENIHIEIDYLGSRDISVRDSSGVVIERRIEDENMISIQGIIDFPL